VSDYVLGPDADHDLDDIWEYIAAESIDAADRWITKLFDGFEAIARSPASGTSGKTSPPTRSCSGRSAPT
jgi:plasmid stabilization system protein ParE